MRKSQDNRPSEAECLRDFDRYGRMIDDWAKRFSIQPVDSAEPVLPNVDYALEPVFHHEIHST